MTKGSEPAFMRRLEDWLTVLDGRKNEALEGIDDFICMYPKTTGCALIALVVLLGICCGVAGIIGEFSG